MVEIKLIPIKDDDLKNIPLSINDAFSSYKNEDADNSYIVTVVFEKSINFFSTTNLFDHLMMNRSNNKRLEMISQIANRVHPAIPKKNEKGLNITIANMIKEKAEEMNPNTSYQIYRVIVIFKSIYDIPQLFCCGFCGFSNYKLLKMSYSISTLLKDTIEENCGCIKNNHSVFVDLDSHDTSRHGDLLKTAF
jgi:hypothetical protein